MEKIFQFLIFVVCYLTVAVEAIDLCKLFGICPQKNNNNNKGRQFPKLPPPKYVDGSQEWIEGVEGQIYHFAENANQMNWYDAEAYCESKGGFLAEPLKRSEHDFLAKEAQRYGADNNWWIGSRLAQNCNCRPNSNTRTANFQNGEFPAHLNSNSLKNRGDKIVKASCPAGYLSNCRENRWTWAFTGLPMSYSVWSSSTGEPNGNGQETCIVMWWEHDFKWADWGCEVNSFKSTKFKPLCQRDADDYDYYYGDDDEYIDPFAKGNDNDKAPINKDDDYDDDDGTDLIDLIDIRNRFVFNKR